MELGKAMRLPSYPTYKHSGIEWLGEVPAHWNTWKATRGFRRIGSGTTPKSDDADYYDGEIPWVTTSELRETIIRDTAKKVTAAAVLDYPTLRVYPKGTLLFAMYGATIGRLGILGVPATVNQACAALAEPVGLETMFTYYWLLMRRPTLIVLSAGGGQPNLSQDDLCQLRIPAPPRSEQFAIADFLDRETSKIDTLVAKKRTLIERLKEKRTGLISRTVTRGLPPGAARAAGFDPHPKLKPSGINWLGDVPEHWSKPKKLGLLSAVWKHSFVNGPFGSDLLTSELESEGIPVIYIRDFSAGRYRRTSEACVATDKAVQLDFCRVDPGDVLIAKVGDPPGTAVVYPDEEPSGIVAQDVIRLRVNGTSVSAKYVAFFLNSLAGRSLIENIAIESTRMRVSLGDYKNSLCILPPLAEQQAIADFLDCETEKIEQLLAKVETAIERLQEYRTALITAAVTGKIDVRAAVCRDESSGNAAEPAKMDA